MPDIRDVPCLSCQKGYAGNHRCDEPDYCPCDRRQAHTNEPKEETPQKRGFHHRIYPYMDEFVQYANESDGDGPPWIVRDRSTSLRNERQGRGKALVRVWVPTDWTLVNELEEG